MGITLINFVEFLVNVFESYITLEFVTKYNKSKYEGVKKYFIAIFTMALLIVNATIFNFITYFSEAMSYISIGIIFIYSITATYGKVKQSFFSCITIILVIIVSNFFATIIFSMIFGISVENLMSEFSVYRFSCLVVSKIILFIITRIMLELRLKGLKNIPSSTIISITLVPILTITVMVIITKASIYLGKDGKTIFYLLLAFIGMIVINIIFYILLVKLEKEFSIEIENRLLKQKISLQYEYVKKAQILYEEIRTIRHDMKNHMVYLKENILNKNYEESLLYMEQLINKIDNTQKLIYTDNFAFDAIVNSKFNEAHNKGIKISYNITCSLCNTIENNDLVSLLGNVLDNAIEACEKLSVKKEIELNVKKEGVYLFIEVKNSIEESILKHNPKFESMKTDKINHGLGVKSIKAIANKYDGLVKYEEENKDLYCNVMIKI